MNATASPKRPYGFSIEAIIGSSNSTRHSTISSGGNLNIPKTSKERLRDSKRDSTHRVHLSFASPVPLVSDAVHRGKSDEEEEEEEDERRTEARVPVPHPHLPTSAQLKSPLSVVTARTGGDRGRGDVVVDVGLPLGVGAGLATTPELLTVRSLWGLTTRGAATPHLPGLVSPGLGSTGLPHPHSLGGPFPPAVAAGLSLSHGLLTTGSRDPLSIYPWLLARPGHCYGYTYPGSAEASFLFHPYRKPKRIRTAFSPSQLLKLEQAFERNHYVVGQERKDLASKLGLTETQVKVWFQNRRTKYKRMKSEEDSADGSANKAHDSPEVSGAGEEVEVEKADERGQDNEEELELVDTDDDEEEAPINCSMSSLT